VTNYSYDPENRLIAVTATGIWKPTQAWSYDSLPEDEGDFKGFFDSPARK
jgi:hypothetical protein